MVDGSRVSYLEHGGEEAHDGVNVCARHGFGRAVRQAVPACSVSINDPLLVHGMVPVMFHSQDSPKEERSRIIEDHADECETSVKGKVELVGEQDPPEQRAPCDLTEPVEDDRGLHGEGQRGQVFGLKLLGRAKGDEGVDPGESEP